MFFKIGIGGYWHYIASLSDNEISLGNNLAGKHFVYKHWGLWTGELEDPEHQLWKVLKPD